MSIESAINKRRQEKANKINETVSACRLHTKQKLDQEAVDIAKLEREIKEDIDRVKELMDAGANKTELEILERHVEEKKRHLRNLEQSKAIVEALSQLETVIRECFKLEWYRYIIRFVPYKRIVKLIKAQNEDGNATLLEVLQLATSNIKSKLKHILTIRA